MAPTWTKRTLALVITVAGFGLLPSCVMDDVGLIDRQKPDQVPKALFEGEWIFAQTTVDAPYSTAASFTGHLNFGDAAKVVFDVQEEFLIAYPVVEAVDGTEEGFKKNYIRKYWAADPEERTEFIEMYTGQPLAIWPIVSHFDLNRDYNSYNGAQSNELVENTTDQPWFKRSHIRVNWHYNQIKPFFMPLGGGSDIGPNSYYVGDQDPNHPDSLTIDVDGGYFDYVVRTNVTSYGSYYCSIYGLSPYDCSMAEVKLRHSFKRLDPKRDYEPLRYHNKEHQDKFGYFLTERPHYDLDYGSSYVGKVSFINRHNLWKNNFDFEYATNADGGEVDCMADNECDEDQGFRCQKDVSDFDPGLCALPVPRPYNQRTLNPTTYHLNADWHPDFLKGAYHAADEWNDTFQEAVSWRLFYEEDGQGHVRGCTTHDECAVDDFGNALVLEDRDVVVTQHGIPCHSNAECGQAFCGTAGVCATQRTCGPGLACALGQTCQDGLCMEGGVEAQQPVEGVSLRGSTLVYHNGGSLLTHDNFSNTVLEALPGDSAYVRFIHAAPEAGALGLTIGSTNMPGGGFDPERDYDPQDPATAPFMAAVPGGTGLTFTVTADGGAAVDPIAGDLVAGNSYVVVYNGDDIVIYGVSFADSQRGVRLIHAAAGESKVDLGVAGVRTDKAVGYKQSTVYQNISGYIQRVTVSREGNRGDLTCYVANAIGRCVGWSRDLKESDLARRDQIKANLPALFVLCENQYDEVDATGDTSTQNMEHYGNARYTYERDGGLYNPCGDPTLVANPTDPKKIGDVRYSTFQWINDMQRAGPLGYGPSIADPETGEIIAGFANIYGGAVHTYGQWAADLLAMVNGDIDTENVVTGEFVRAAMEDREEEQDAQLATTFGGLANANPSRSHKHPILKRFDTQPTLSHPALGEGLGFPHLATDLQARPDLMGAPSKPVPDYHFEELNELLRHPENFQAELAAQLPTVEATYYQDRLAKLRGTPIEAMMMNNEVLRTAPFVARGEGLTNMNLIGLPFDGEPLSDGEVEEQLSPVNWASKSALRSEEERVRFLARNNMYMGEFIDDSLWGLAKELKDQGLDYDQIRTEVSQRILQGVLEHEIGHTVGLRHNFSGSTDVFNFHDEYYEIREKEVILCQDDGWCDQLTGEVCAYEACNADSDCITGMLCVSNQCSAPSNDDGTELIPTGVCSRPVGDSPCTTDSQCDGDAGQVCVNGECFQPNEQFVPRVWLTDNERAQKRTQYQYTTTMDYGGRFNSDFQGLGKYDYAAIRFGYSQLVDTYADTSRLRNRVEQAAQITGSASTQYSYFLNTRWWPTRGVGFWHPFNYLNNYIGVAENLNRIPRPYEQVKYQHAMVSNDVREYIDFEDIEVPYAFCSDEYRGNMGCYYFDLGIDAGEMSRHARDQLEQYYIFDAFKRERLYFGRYGSAMSYFGRIMDRYLRVLGDVGMYYAMWETFLFRYGWYNEWKDSPMGGRTLERAAINTFGYLMDAVASPAPGSYAYDEDKDAYVNISLKQGTESSEFDIPLGVGRYPYTQYGQSLGYTYQEHPLWFGSFWEKVASLLTLTDSTAYFVGQSVGEQLNIGVGTSLGFNTVFSDEMNLFLGSVIGEEMDLYAGRVNQGKYAPPSLTDDLDFDNTVAVEPALNNFTLKLYAAVFGLAYLPAGFDPRFIDATAVFIEGEATHYTHANEPGVIEFRFEDPIGGKVYLAYSNNYGEYDQTRIAAGATLVERGQDLADEWADATGTEKEKIGLQIQQTREILDVLRGLNQIYGASTLGL